jgi:hypothetical protein
MSTPVRITDIKQRRERVSPSLPGGTAAPRWRDS